MGDNQQHWHYHEQSEHAVIELMVRHPAGSHSRTACVSRSDGLDGWPPTSGNVVGGLSGSNLISLSCRVLLVENRHSSSGTRSLWRPTHSFRLGTNPHRLGTTKIKSGARSHCLGTCPNKSGVHAHLFGAGTHRLRMCPLKLGVHAHRLYLCAHRLGASTHLLGVRAHRLGACAHQLYFCLRHDGIVTSSTQACLVLFRSWAAALPTTAFSPVFPGGEPFGRFWHVNCFTNCDSQRD